MRTIKLTRIDAWRDKPPSYPHPLRRWLADRGSLTSRITAHFPDFNLKRLGQSLQVPHPDERRHMDFRTGELAVVREVLLKSGDTPLVFAHSVTARRDLRDVWRGISRLGSRPLAEMLFHDPTVARLPMEYHRIDARHPLFRRTMAVAPHDDKSLWARRSVFVKHARPLLVTEVFLPAVASRRLLAREQSLIDMTIAADAKGRELVLRLFVGDSLRFTAGLRKHAELKDIYYAEAELLLSNAAGQLTCIIDSVDMGNAMTMVDLLTHIAERGTAFQLPTEFSVGDVASTWSQHLQKSLSMGEEPQSESILGLLRPSLLEFSDRARIFLYQVDESIFLEAGCSDPNLGTVVFEHSRESLLAVAERIRNGIRQTLDADLARAVS